VRVITAGDAGSDFGKAELSFWHVAPGALVEKDADLVEFADSKNVFVVKAPARMRIVRIVAEKSSAVVPTTVLCEGEDA